MASTVELSATESGRSPKQDARMILSQRAMMNFMHMYRRCPDRGCRRLGQCLGADAGRPCIRELRPSITRRIARRFMFQSRRWSWL